MKANNKRHDNAVMSSKIYAVPPAQEHDDENEESCFLLLNIHHQVVTINKGFSRLMNMEASFADTTPFKSIYRCLPVHHAAWFGKLSAIAQTGKSCHHELLVKGDDDRERWMKFEFSPVYNRRNMIKGIMCIGTNINKEKMQEQKLATQKLLLKKIADTYSHQLRHPLTNILAIIDIMKYDDMTMSKLYFECLEKASKQLDAVIHVVVNQTYTAA